MFSSVVTKKFNEPNVILAGSPAKIIKKDTNWSIETTDKFVEESVC